MERFVFIIELLQQVNVLNLTIDVLVDDLGHMWFVDACNFVFDYKPSN